MKVEILPMDWHSTAAKIASVAAGGVNQIDLETAFTTFGQYSDKFRVKFTFSDSGNGTGQGDVFRSPQLFEVQVDYYYDYFTDTNHDLAPPESYVYSKE